MNDTERPTHESGEPPAATRAWLGDVVDEHYGGYFVWEPASGLLWCSDALLAAVGRTRADFPPHYDSFRELLPPEDLPRTEAELRAHVEAGREYAIEFRMRHRDGGLRDVDSRATTRVDEDGRRWYVGTIRDVTEERATRLALETSEAHFRQLADNIPGAVFRYLLRADGRDGVEYMSKGCEEIWEISAEEIEREPSAVWRRVLAEDIGGIREAVARSAADLADWDHTFRIRTESGHLKWLHGRGTPVRREDGSTLWNSIVLDISELRRAEAELRESQQQLARASKLEAIGKLTGGVAHDFNNLLAVIVGNAELLGDEADPAALREGLEQIRNAAERGSALTRSLLNFARQAPLAPTSQDLCAVVRDSLDLYRRTVPASIRIATELPSSPCHVVVDRNTLENALLNLVINARDAMRDGGTLTLRVRADAEPRESCPECDLESTPHHEIAVLDTGRGMAPEILERVFDPFFSTKSMTEGSGLGLSMVHGFVSQSGGCVCVDSTPGAGTKVAMLFPTGRPEAPRAGARAAETSRGLPPLRTLLVEDDPAVRALLAKLLERAGLVVITAGTGDAALEAIDEDRGLELIVTDMVLPGSAQGTDVVRQARALRPGVPILVLTGYAEDAKLLEDDGAVDAVLTKPARRERLLETLAQIIEGARAAS